jgi:TonB family protein
MRVARWSIAAMALLCATGCGERSTKRMVQAFQAGAAHPDEEPKVLNTELPFRYPAALYARRIQGNVTLRLLIDTTGQVNADSTRIEESSGYASLDSAAVKGSLDLRFVPAKLHGDPIATTVLFPVYFRHPEAHALPGDTILNKRATP